MDNDSVIAYQINIINIHKQNLPFSEYLKTNYLY